MNWSFQKNFVNKMSDAAFKSLDITTVTAIVYLNGRIEVNPAFFLTEIYRIGDDRTNYSKKTKLPKMSEAGRVLSLTALFDDKTHFVRGIKRSGSLKNAKTMDVSVTGKNINLKIYEDQIHMCGAKSKEMAIEAAEIVIQKVKQAQEMLDYIRSHPTETYDTVEWIRDKTLGEVEYVEAGTTNIVKKEDILQLTSEMIRILVEDEMSFHEGDDTYVRNSLMSDATSDNIVNEVDSSLLSPNLVGFIPSNNERGWISVEKTNYIILPDEFESQGFHHLYSSRPTDTYPGFSMNSENDKMIDGKIANFFLDMAYDHQRHDVYITQLDWISTIDRVLIKDTEMDSYGDIIFHDLTVKKVMTSMINYNYNLGFRIVNSELNEYMKNILGFVPVYENTHDHSVKIYLPYEIPDDLIDEIKIQRKPKNSFMVYRTGSVTQSSSNEILAREAYVLFNRAMKTLRPMIEDTSSDVTNLNSKTVDDVISGAKKNGVDMIKEGYARIVGNRQKSADF